MDKDENIIIVELITNSSGWKQGGCSRNRLVWYSRRNVYHTVGWEPAHTHHHRIFSLASGKYCLSSWWVCIVLHSARVFPFLFSCCNVKVTVITFTVQSKLPVVPTFTTKLYFWCQTQSHRHESGLTFWEISLLWWAASQLSIALRLERGGNS